MVRTSRLGTPKQLVDADCETLVHRAARQLVDAGCDPVFVVVGAARDAVVDALRDVHVEIVVNEAWSEGVASSIRSAVSAARSHSSIDALLLTTCDMPTVGVSHLNALCIAYRAGARRAASRYVTVEGTDTLGIPAIVGAGERPVLSALQGDRGAKHLFYEDGTITVDLVGGSFDIDRPSDVQALKNL